jgi:hypothetical protein
MVWYSRNPYFKEKNNMTDTNQVTVPQYGPKDEQLAMDYAPPKLYTQADMDSAMAAVRTEEEVRVTQAERSRITATNELKNYKAEVGRRLSDFVLEHDLMDDAGVATATAELFDDLGIEDYLPRKEFLVEVTFEGKTWINVEAHSEEAAIEYVQNNSATYDVEQAVKDNDVDIEVWQTTGEVNPY